MRNKIIFLALAVLAVFLMGARYLDVTSVTASWTTVCDLEVSSNRSVSFGLHNTGVTNALTACQVESQVGPTLATDWDVLDDSWTACKTLAAGGMTSWSINGNFVRLRVRAKSAAGTSTHCRQQAN
jgi:hypothetical protein